jgi:hypothetical protein
MKSMGKSTGGKVPPPFVLKLLKALQSTVIDDLTFQRTY